MYCTLPTTRHSFAHTQFDVCSPLRVRLDSSRLLWLYYNFTNHNHHPFSCTTKRIHSLSSLLCSLLCSLLTSGTLLIFALITNFCCNRYNVAHMRSVFIFHTSCCQSSTSARLTDPLVIKTKFSSDLLSCILFN